MDLFWKFFNLLIKDFFEYFFESHLFIQLVTCIDISSFASFCIFAGISLFELFEQSISFIIFEMFSVETDSKENIKNFDDSCNWNADKKDYFLRFSNERPKYLFILISACYGWLEVYIKSPFWTQTTTFFKNSVFPHTIIESNNFDHPLGKSESFSNFQTNTLKLMRKSLNSVYDCHNPGGNYLLQDLGLACKLRKALINDPLHISKSIRKISHSKYL